MNRRQFLSTAAAPAFIRARGSAAERPNVLWILGDDLGLRTELLRLPRRQHAQHRPPGRTRACASRSSTPRRRSARPAAPASTWGCTRPPPAPTTTAATARTATGCPRRRALITDRFREQGYFTCNVLRHRARRARHRQDRLQLQRCGKALRRHALEPAQGRASRSTRRSTSRRRTRARRSSRRASRRT